MNIYRKKSELCAFQNLQLESTSTQEHPPGEFMNALHYQSYVKAKIVSAFVSAIIIFYVKFYFLPKMIDHSQTQLIATNLVPRAFLFKNGWGGPPHPFLREKPWGRG